MKDVIPLGLDRGRVQQLVEAAKTATRAGLRIDLLSAALIGQPYQSNPLIGSAERPEVFTAEMKGFDCVTFVEVVLALAQSGNPDRFVEALRQLRYAGGRVDWKRRNHYMTEWIRNNVKSGRIGRIRPPKPSVKKDRVLDMVPGLGPRRMTFTCVPKKSFLRSPDAIATGDLIFFASTRARLDVFHCGILVNNGDRLLMRHASRSRGRVVEQDLEEFLKQNRMAGVILARPAEAQ